jgi:hypothetical protein
MSTDTFIEGRQRAPINDSFVQFSLSLDAANWLRLSPKEREE